MASPWESSTLGARRQCSEGALSGTDALGIREPKTGAGREWWRVPHPPPASCRSGSTEPNSRPESKNVPEQVPVLSLWAASLPTPLAPSLPQLQSLTPSTSHYVNHWKFPDDLPSAGMHLSSSQPVKHLPFLHKQPKCHVVHPSSCSRVHRAKSKLLTKVCKVHPPTPSLLKGGLWTCHICHPGCLQGVQVLRSHLHLLSQIGEASEVPSAC